MTPSPVQILQLFFQKVNIEFDAERAPKELPNPLTNVFTFDGVALSTEVAIYEADRNHERGQIFGVSLSLKIQNVVDTEQPEQLFSPYLIDISADALILVRNGSDKFGPPETLALVNGASLIWSAIREQVLNNTSRMKAGPVMLPTVHFQDLKNQLDVQTPVEEKKVEQGASSKSKKKMSKP